MTETKIQHLFYFLLMHKLLFQKLSAVKKKKKLVYN
jgi:hypothetical protein